jgi:hypothetical protein
MRRQLDKFNENNQAPEPPAKFDSVVALLEYDDRKRLYEKDLEDHRLRATRRQQAFEQKSLRFMKLFPDGVPLVYQYKSYGAGPVGKTFEIQKVVAEDQPSIEIRELDS